MTLYNPSRQQDQVLTQHTNDPPSFTVNFYPEHWTLNNSRPNLYHTPISFLLDDIRARRIPVDWAQLLDQNGTVYYDGSLIVELVDYRSASAEDKPTTERIVLPLDSEGVWNDIRLEHERSGKITTDEEAIDLEARIVAATSPPLCLDPDPVVSRIANLALRSSALLAPTAFKKKDVAAEHERDSALKARGAKIMSLMNPHAGRPMHPSPRLFEIIQRNQATNRQPAFQNPDPHAVPIAHVGQNTPTATPAPVNIQAGPIQLKDPVLLKRKLKSGKSEDGLQSPVVPETPEDPGQPSSTSIKRKASLTAPTPPPLAKKKTNVKGKSESVEPSPAQGQVQLPNVAAPQHPQHSQAPQAHPHMQQPHAAPQMAYQLPPSTQAAIPLRRPPPNLARKQSGQMAPVKKPTLEQQAVPSPQIPHAQAQTPQQTIMGTPVSRNAAPMSHQSPPLPPPSHPHQSKPSTPQPRAPSATPMMPQHSGMSQQHNQFAQHAAANAAMLGANNHAAMNSAAAHFQQQHQLQNQQNMATSSPRPPQQGLPHGANPNPAMHGQLSYQQQQQHNQMLLRAQAARMNQVNSAMHGQAGQLNPHMQQYMAIQMANNPNQAQFQQQQSHVPSPQISQQRSPHPGVTNQAPSRPGSTMPPHGLAQQMQNNPQIQGYANASNALRNMMSSQQGMQQLQAHMQQQAQQQQQQAPQMPQQLSQQGQQQQVPQFGMGMGANGNFTFQLPMGGQMNPNMMGQNFRFGVQGLPQGVRLPSGQQGQQGYTQAQLIAMQQANLAAMNRAGMPGSGQGR